MSVQCSLLSDFYFPGQFVVAPYLHQLAIHPIRTVPIGSIQWELDFLISNIGVIVSQTRKNKISGKHTPYVRFPYRNKVVATFAQTFNEVGFIDTTQFHDQSQESKLSSWIDSGFHLIVPVGGDIPIRFFDALVTGGIPVVPYSMTQLLANIGVHDNHYCTYGPGDLLDPNSAINYWESRFGAENLLDRYSRVIKYASSFHVDSILEKLISYSIEELENCVKRIL
jgi:hypothetical protein